MTTGKLPAKKEKKNNMKTETSSAVLPEKKEQMGSWDSLLIKEEEATGKEEDYVQPNIEHKLPPGKRKECREILREIKDFGISQRQMLYLIYLMSLELEDVPTMRALVKVIGENRESTPVSSTGGIITASGEEQVGQRTTNRIILDE